jgi:hypothetical protein
MFSPALSAALAFLLVQNAPSPPSPARLDSVIQSVSRNVREFQELLPDFVCKETITSATYKSGKVRKMTTVESIFTAVQKPDPNSPGRGRAAFTESRDVTSVDGKPVRHGTRMPRLPVQFAGAFGSLLTMTFSPENLQFHRYDLDARQPEAGKVLVRFATREDQQKLRTFFEGEMLIDKDSGRALIDASAMQVIHLEREFLMLPRRLTHLTIAADYAPVSIDGREFWLPRIIRSDGTERDPQNTQSYNAAYTDCKKFVADIRIVPE